MRNIKRLINTAVRAERVSVTGLRPWNYICVYANSTELVKLDGLLINQRELYYPLKEIQSGHSFSAFGGC